MKNLKKWMFVFGLLGLILSGCGTTDNNDKQANGSDQTQNEEINKEKQENQNTEDGQDAVEPKNDEQTKEDDGVVRILEQNLQYSVNGEAKEETAFLKSSDNQLYSMYVLPEFELTAEEPQKDVLYLTENDHVFMRIELLPPDVQWDMVEENTKAQLQAVDETVQSIEVPSGDEFFKDAIAMESTNGDDVVTSYLIKNSNQPLKLTLFTKKDLDYKDAFVQMGKTILITK